ncbi:PAS domain-containing protein [Proteobacteria bacterium 005FR1]|nr:PAS domain-containing protein [Proteobacteria bacterium 005FR1]
MSQYREIEAQPTAREISERAFPGQSEVARLCREKDWSRTPLGSLRAWDASLCSTAGLVLNSPVPMALLWGPELVQIYNDAYRWIMGDRHPAGLGQPAREYCPESLEFDAYLYERVLQEGASFSLESQRLPTNRHGSLEEAFFNVSFSPLFDDLTQIAGVLVTVSETTGASMRADAERRSSESEARFRALATATNDVVYRMSADWQEMRALDGRGTVADTTRPNRSWLSQYIHPDDHAAMMAAVHEAIRNKSTFELEHRVRRADGEFSWTCSRAVPLLDSEADITEWIGTANDITERREAMRALEKSEARYRFLFDAIDEGFCIVEMLFNEHDRAVDYRYLDVNPAFERHTGLRNAVGRRMRSLAPDMEDYWFEIYGRVAKTGEPTRFQMPAAALEDRWFDVYAFRIDEPALGRVAVLFSDISQRKYNEELQQHLASADSFRVKLADALRPLEKPGEILRCASRMLGEQLSASRVLYAELTPDGQYALVFDDYRKDVPSIAGRHRVADYGPTAKSEMLTGRTFVVSDVASDPRLSAKEREVTLGIMIGAYVSIPLVKEGRVVAIFIAHQSTSRDWTRREIKLMEETADRTWAAVERARAEIALRDALQHNTRILESIGDCFYALDAERRFTYVNAQTEAYLGIPKEEMLGRKYWDVLPAVRGHEVMLKQQQALSERRTIRFETLSPVTGRWVELSVFPTDDGGLTVYFRDVTDRVRARAQQSALLELGDRLRVLSSPVEIMGTAAAIVGSTLNALRAGYGTVDKNCEWLEVTRDWTDGSVVSTAGKWRLDDFWGGFREALQIGEPVLLEDLSRDPRADESCRKNFAALSVRSLMDIPLVADDQLVAIFYVQFREPRAFVDDEASFVRDVTDRTWAALRRAYSDLALRESDRRKDEFLAMLAHELRNPLAVIGNTVRLLEEQPQSQQRFVQVLSRQTSMLRGLVADLLDVSRITRGLVELSKQPVDVTAIATQALESVQSLMQEKQHRLSVDFPERSPTLMGDPVRLEQILVNLLTNAAKYTDPQGEISLHLRQLEGEVEIRVADTGIGMNREVLERIFDLFGQAERGLARSEGGLGIGLTIAKKLVELHAGQIEAHSEGPGKGASFVVRLPASPSEHALPNTTAMPSAKSESRRILVVDDNPEIAETLSLLLEHAGHRVERVHSGPAALAMAPAFQPDVILLDIGLPEMDGYEVARRLRDQPRTASAVLAALTGYGQPSDRERAHAAGFDAHFVKPVDLDVLLDFVARASSS